jgi:hypothetical protein
MDFDAKERRKSISAGVMDLTSAGGKNVSMKLDWKGGECSKDECHECHYEGHHPEAIAPTQSPARQVLPHPLLILQNYRVI